MTCRYDIDMFRYSLTWIPSTSGGKCSCLKTVIPKGSNFPTQKSLAVWLAESLSGPTMTPAAWVGILLSWVGDEDEKSN